MDILLFILGIFAVLWLLCGFCTMCFCLVIDRKMGARCSLLDSLVIIVGGLFAVYYAIDAFTAMDDDPFIE